MKTLGFFNKNPTIKFRSDYVKNIFWNVQNINFPLEQAAKQTTRPIGFKFVSNTGVSSFFLGGGGGERGLLRAW